MQGAFVKAADYLSSLIVGDVADVTLADGTFVDDLNITAELASIDGQFGILGSAGPRSIRNDLSEDDWIPITGEMRYDTADAQWMLSEGYLDDVAVHEIMHTLGFGTVWHLHGVTQSAEFVGENAVAAYRAQLQAEGVDHFDIRGVPIETDGGQGTAGSHWDEDVFTTELMTGWLNQGAASPMSAMSIASLEDLGYDTVFDANNPLLHIMQLDELLFA